MVDWQPERTLTEMQITNIIEQQFSLLKPAKLQLLGVGWDNVAYVVNEHYLFRFPRREITAPLLLTEIKLLPYLSSQLDLPIPNPIFLGRPTRDFPWSFMGYAMLPGHTACSQFLSAQQRIALAKPLALFLKQLHQIDVSVARQHGAIDDQFDRLGLALRIPRIKERLETLFSYGILGNETTWLQYLKSCEQLTSSNTLCLTHGDLYARHLLLDDDTQLCGIIDWGDANISHPALDLSIIHSFLPTQAHDVFIKHYGTIDESTWQLAKFRALYSLVTMAVYSHDVNDKNLLAESYAGLELLYQGMC